VGQVPGVRLWPGVETGCRYPFGDKRRVGYVDRLDGLHWLRAGERGAFRLEGIE